jgi:hypothetical protein
MGNNTSICACGRKMSKYYFNSTIKRKQCPNCELKNKLSGDAKAVKKGLRGKQKQKKESPQTRAMKNADLWFSRYIRIKYAFKIQDGIVYCQCIVDRWVIKEAKYMDNGHYHSRGHQATRYYEDNCRPQNRSSNRFKGEMDKAKFGDNLKSEIGQYAFNELNLMYRQQIMVSELYFKEIATKYRKLVNQLVKEHDIKKWW